MTVKNFGLLFVAFLQTVGVVLLSLFYHFQAMIMCLLPRAFKRYDITGKVVLITGSGSGLGRLMAVKLAKKGCKMVLWDVNAFGNEETAKMIRNNGGSCYAYTLDLSDRVSVYATAEVVKREVGQVNILVNNAGIVTGGSFLELSDEKIVKTFEVNIISHFWTTKAFLPEMKKNNEGQIVTIASVAGQFGANRLVDYCASKFANVGFHESLSLELSVEGYNGIRTTLVCPYYINTGMFEGVESKILPILEQDYVANEITDAILMRKRQLILPPFLNLLVALKGFFSEVEMKHLGRVMKINNSMVNFVGRRKQH